MKNEIEKELGKLFAKAKKNKIKIAVASDEEGNNFNLIGTVKDFTFGDTKENVIVLAVDGYIDEEKLFDYEDEE